MDKRTKSLRICLTPTEAEELKKHACGYGSISHYVRMAVREYYSHDLKGVMEQMRTISEFYKETINILSHDAGNLNQTAKRANELAIAGNLSQAYFSQVILPAIKTNLETITSVKDNLLSVSKRLMKHKLK